MHMKVSVLSGAALLACGSLVFAGPLSRRQDINNNLLAPINPDGMNTLPNTPITIASLLTPPAADHFPTGPLVLPEYPINNIGNTLTANTVSGTGLSTDDGIIQAPQQAATNFVDQLGNPQPIASTLLAATSFEADVQQRLKSIQDQSNSYCLWDLSIDVTTYLSSFNFRVCGQGDWKAFRKAVVDDTLPGYAVYQLETNKILSIMHNLYGYHTPDVNLADIDTKAYLHDYKKQWVDLLDTVYTERVSRDDVNLDGLNQIDTAIAQGVDSLQSDPK